MTLNPFSLREAKRRGQTAHPVATLQQWLYGHAFHQGACSRSSYKEVTMFHPRIFKAALWLVPIMAITLSPLRAQENAKSEKQEKAGHGRQNVTGCLQKGDEPGGFTLTGDDGKVWELTSSSDVNLADHVGHK